MEKDLLAWLVQQAPVIVVLGIALWYMNKKVESKEAEVKELNGYVREKTLEMLMTLKDTVTILDKVTEGQSHVKDEIREMAERIIARIDKFEIDTLRNGSKGKS